MIEIKNLAKYYGNLAAVDDLSLTIQEGDIFGFIGPNGAGKTTTMRILVTLLEPTSGQAFINNLNVAKNGKKVRRLVGYMPDFMGVYDDLKVFEYLEFFAAAFVIERKKRKAIIEGVLELTDLQSKQSGTDRPAIQAKRCRRQPLAGHAAEAGPGPRSNSRSESAHTGRTGQRAGSARQN